MLLRIKHADFSSDVEREKFAKRISCIVEGENNPELPYRPNTGDSSYWKLDIANDWVLSFDDGAKDQCRIRYRYSCTANPYEESLAGWLVVHFAGFCEILEANAQGDATASLCPLRSCHDCRFCGPDRPDGMILCDHESWAHWGEEMRVFLPNFAPSCHSFDGKRKWSGAAGAVG